MRQLAAVLVVLAAVAGSARADRDELLELRDQLRKAEARNDYPAAVELATKRVELATKLKGPDSREQIDAREDLARDLDRAGEFTRSLKEYEALAALAEKQHGSDSHQLLYALSAETIPLGDMQRNEEVIAIEQRMVEISKKVNGEDSVDHTTQLRRLAGTLFYQRNEYASAMQVYDQVLRILDKLGPDKAGDMLYAMNLEIGMLYWQLNQRPKAIAMFDRALQLKDQDRRATPMSVADSRWMIAQLYHRGGRDDLAKPLVAKALEVFDREIARLEKDKPDDWQLPVMLSNSATVLRVTGDLAGAEQRLRRAIAIDTRRNGFSTTTLTLADLQESRGNYKEALALYEQTTATMTKRDPVFATEYNVQMGRILLDLGEYKRAEKLIQDRMTYAERKFGRDHPLYVNAEFQLGLVYEAAGDIAGAERAFAHSFANAERKLEIALQTGTDSDHAIYFQNDSYWLDTALNFNAKVAPKNAAAARLALTTLLQRKGRLLDASAEALATIRRKLSPEDKQLLDDLAAARAQLAKLTVGGAGAAGGPDAYAKQVAALEDRIQKLELEVGKKSAAYRAASTRIDLAAVQKLIPADAKLVEIVNYQPSDPKKTSELGSPREPRRYAAYVVGHTGDPQLVQLGGAAEIDDAVEKFRKAVADPDNDRATELGHALYALTFAKIAPALGRANNLLIAPDGTLNVVPFSALVDDHGDFLVQHFTFTYLTSGRDLARLAVKTRAQGGGVIIADPSFDVTGTAQPAGSSRGRRSADFANLVWPPLPGTGKEADAVAKTWAGLRVLRGADATEAAVKSVRGPKILHLATHGFFLPDAPVPEGAGNEARENPLLRSGLALAGANKLTSGDEDGILTALEASGLDLEGTKLVVLSACETGVGKVTNGDGVYGLRRALVIAGAESLVMSMWQVDDEATKELMVGYYARLAKGESRSAALREVQRDLMAKPRYKHPYYWASFLAAGDDSPMN
jgi:CHAT domain-containing protein